MPTKEVVIENTAELPINREVSRCVICTSKNRSEALFTNRRGGDPRYRPLVSAFTSFES